MGYRIDYPPVKKVRCAEKRKAPAFALTAILLVLLVLLVNVCWPDGRRVLLSFLIPGDAAVTVSALETMTEELKEGQSLAESLQEFCLRVMTG